MGDFVEDDGPVRINTNRKNPDKSEEDWIIELPRLTSRDYLTWLSEYKTQRVEAERRAVAAMEKVIPWRERLTLLQQIETFEVVPDDLIPLVHTAEGSLRVLDMATVKAKADENTKAFIESLPSVVQRRIAIHVCGLLSAKYIARMENPEPASKGNDKGQATFGGGQNPPVPGSENPANPSGLTSTFGG